MDSVTELEMFFDAQTERIAAALAKPSTFDRARLREERPSRKEIMRHGTSVSRGNTCHAPGVSKHGS